MKQQPSMIREDSILDRSLSSAKARRDRIEKQTAKFLADGGVITEVVPESNFNDLKTDTCGGKRCIRRSGYSRYKPQKTFDTPDLCTWMNGGFVDRFVAKLEVVA